MDGALCGKINYMITSKNCNQSVLVCVGISYQCYESFES